MNPYNPEKCLLKKRRKFQLALNADTGTDVRSALNPYQQIRDTGLIR